MYVKAKKYKESYMQVVAALYKLKHFNWGAKNFEKPLIPESNFWEIEVVKMAL